jgi:hypothetical protein
VTARMYQRTAEHCNSDVLRHYAGELTNLRFTRGTDQSSEKVTIRLGK